MFISEQEANERLRSNDNLLNRLKPAAQKPSEPTPPKSPDYEYADEDPIARQSVIDNPTFASEDDAIRMAVLAGRRHLKTSAQRGGKYRDQGNVPPIFRSLIGSAGRLGTVNETAKAFGVSAPSVVNYKHGRTSSSGEVNPDMLSSIERDTHAIRKQVLGVLAFTIAKITPESIENKEPKELSIIARNLSSVMAGTRPIEAPDQSRNAQVIVFSPEQQKDDDYKTIEIG